MSDKAFADAEAEAQKGLPKPWRAVVDRTSGDIYFWNEETDETSWLRPTSHSMKLPKGWVAVLDEESGEYFYWNQTTDQTQWEVPTATGATTGGAAGGAAAAASGGAASGGAAATATEEEDKAGADYVAAGKRKNRQVIMAESYDPTAGGAKAADMIKRVEKADKSKEVIRAALQGPAAFLFSSLSPAELDTVVMAMTEKVVAPGETIIRQGDKGDYFYVAEAGTYSIFVGTTKVASRGPGDAFGELALLYNCPRAATIQADTPGRLWALDRVTFRYMVASTREGQLEDIVRGLRAVELLKSLTEDQLNRVAEAVKVVSFKKGERIITKGELGNECYFVSRGKVRCFGATAAGKPMEDMYIAAGGYFGERALLLGAPRAANVEADSDDVSLYVLARKEFTELLGPLKNLLEQDTILRVLNSIPVLAALSKGDRDRVISRLQTLDLADKALLAKAGQALNTFFFVKSGGLRVVRGGKEEVMGQGGYLGDRALLKPDVADADYIATGATTLFALDRREFEAVVARSTAAANAPAADAGAASAATAAAAPTAAAAAADAPVVLRRATNIKREDLEIIRTLGAGTFGRVKLVRHKPTNKPMAMKILQKAQVVAYSQQKNVMNERNVMMMVDHPFVLKLETTFKDAHCLYMLLEYVQGGELFSYLSNSKLGYIPVDDARFYAACVLAGVGALHDKNILYRDLKPENMMIDREGYIKVVDMGFAKVVRDRTYTLCGTPEYLAPELVLGQGHYKGVDIWAIGVLLYEMVSGHSPFYDPVGGDQMVICKNIVKGKFAWPAHVKDKEIKDLVAKILVRNVTSRLGCRKDGISEVMDHKFFDPLDWSALVAKRIKAPWLPPVKDAFDASCFDRYDGPEEIAPYADDGSGWDADF